jgi:uncharacterized protein
MTRLIIGLAAIFSMITVISCQMESHDPYVLKVKRDRFIKDSFLKGSNESPLDENEKKDLIALDYYAPDANYDVKGRLEFYSVPKSVKIQRTNEEPEEYYNLGQVVFNLNGKENKLSVYQRARFIKDTAFANELFCPFTDETNGKGTYKSGRFLDLKLHPGSKEIEIDFNYAYNPYCAYNHGYSCPVPPAENHLDLKVEAGEKNYKRGGFSIFK